MKALILLAVFSAAVMAEKDYDAMFKQFKATHLKAYASEAEESQRFKNFISNMKKADVLQAANPLATFGANKFADMSAEEFQTFLGGTAYYAKAATKIRNFAAPPTVAQIAATADDKIDWRKEGKVSKVKNQGSCGSCWAYSTTGNIEGVYSIANNADVVPLSEQELTSCDNLDGGCGGGLMDNAFKWILEVRKGEIVTEEAYPYESGSGTAPKCRTDELDSMAVGATIISYTHLAKSEDDLAVNVKNAGPTSVAVDATSFQSYVGGILTSCINRQMNHGVVAVGYDTANVPPYWIIKNSWGANWGEEGYLRLAKGSNECLINSYITTAVPKKV